MIRTKIIGIRHNGQDAYVNNMWIYSQQIIMPNQTKPKLEEKKN